MIHTDMKKIWLFLCTATLLLTACIGKKQKTEIPGTPSTGHEVAAAAPVAAEAKSPGTPAGEDTVIVVVPPSDTEPDRVEFVDPDAFVGCYKTGGYDTLTIQNSEDGYSMSVSLYRLTTLDEGTVSASPDGIVFHTVDAAGDSMTITFFTEDGARFALRIDESTWPLLPQGTVIDRWEKVAEAPMAEHKHQGHYVFQPKICSVYMEEVFGKDMCDAWSNLVDAVLAGEDTFACKDQYTYDWMMGQFPEHCLPILHELIDYAWDREHSVIDGIASFTYRVPPEEAQKRIAEFGQQIEGMLNEILEDDWSDFEKTLALYIYFSEHYVYDYDTYIKMNDEYVDYTSCYRFFQTGIGICHEISSAYSYLLLQAGVQATTMSGNRTYDQAGHQWSFVRINGKNYHIDPTYVLGSGNDLRYFLMTDSQREAEDCYDPATFYAVSH